MTGMTRHPASFRDPSGFVFRDKGKVYRQVNKIYARNYEHFIQSGLYQLLKDKEIITPHIEIKENINNSDDWHITLLPEQISFISYPYEWCFEQLKDAALLTLEIVKHAVDKGMILKDATPFNIQFYKGKPVFIDTLSFEEYDESKPWIAYRQFCESFLFPLWLAHYHKINFQNILSVYPEGIPVEIAAKLFPAKSRLNPGVWLHVSLPRSIGKKNISSNASKRDFSKKKLLDVISHLESIISKLDNHNKTTWSHYYSETAGSAGYIPEKEKIFLDYIAQAKGSKMLDIGANEGYFSILSAEKGFDVIAIDSDEQSLNSLYTKTKTQRIPDILPLCVDIANPSPAAGFANRERDSFASRVQPDIVLALALVHHLAIGKNISLFMLAEYLHQLAPQLIIEFVPKEDEKTQILLRNKPDIYREYTIHNFESIFQKFFTIVQKTEIKGTFRVLYLMEKLKTS